MVKAKVFLFAKQFEGVPKADNVKLIEEELRQLNDGEFLAEALYLSVDPFIRIQARNYKLNMPLVGVQVASDKLIAVYTVKVKQVGLENNNIDVRIIESKNSKFPVGENVVGFFGWRTHTIADGTHADKDKIPKLIEADLGDLPLSLLLGVLGRPGHSAYFGLLDLCRPKKGETLVISGAAGAVGHIVGQIAKIKGLKVIGIVGSDEKGNWLVNELGFDHCINYKTDNIDAALKKFAPEGVDCYFDNVGGEISSTVIHHLNKFGRVSLCGSISQYNEKEVPKVTSIYRPIISNILTLEGFMCARWVDIWHEALNQNLEWIKEGKLKYKETVTVGFENMFQAFVEMLSGKNFGKAIVKV